MSATAPPPPPQLIFDDGSRIMTEESSLTTAAAAMGTNLLSPTIIRGSISLEEYYEIDRISKEILSMMISTSTTNDSLFRIALQFPDELLDDSPEVCWMLEEVLLQQLTTATATTTVSTTTTFTNVMVFCLGDTTVGSCCPDEVAALHLQANVLVHYGHACLSPTGTLPVIYSFGKLEFNIPAAVNEIMTTTTTNDDKEQSPQKILLLYHVGYHHAMKEFQETLQNNIQGSVVVMAQLPKPTMIVDGKNVNITSLPLLFSSSTTCCGSGTTDPSCCGEESFTKKTEMDTSTSSSSLPSPVTTTKTTTPCDNSSCVTSNNANDNSTNCSSNTTSQQQNETSLQKNEETTEHRRRPLIVGGLELPESSIQSWEDLADFTVLFIGNPEGSAMKRQYVNIMLRFLSLSTPPKAYWTYTPASSTTIPKQSSSSSTTSIEAETKTESEETHSGGGVLTTTLPPSLNLQLKRRFFLTQKARDAHVFGIVVSNLSQQNLIQVVKSLERRIQDAGKASYNFAVGKINPAKLANFAEIECFVLVACREHSLLDNERDYHVPIITPLELDIALGNLTWGAQAYSLDCLDALLSSSSSSSVMEDSTSAAAATATTSKAGNDSDGNDDDNDDDDDDDDAPYFSLVTGTYVQRTKKDTTLDLEQLPGKGQVMAYKSEAANFLKQREYQGLSTDIGQTEVKAAVPGQQGIASDYSGI